MNGSNRSRRATAIQRFMLKCRFFLSGVTLPPSLKPEQQRATHYKKNFSSPSDTCSDILVFTIEPVLCQIEKVRSRYAQPGEPLTTKFSLCGRANELSKRLIWNLTSALATTVVNYHVVGISTFEKVAAIKVAQNALDTAIGGWLPHLHPSRRYS